MLVAATADWLFLRHPVGISVALFICIFVTVVAVAHRTLVPGRTLLTSVGVLGASLLPIVMNFSLLSLLVGLAGASFLLLAATGHVSFDLLDGLMKIIRLIFGGPVQMIFDLTRASAMLKRSDTPVFGRNQIVAWGTTLGLGTVFLILFSAANPLISKWISEIDILWALGQLDYVRLLFWCVCMALAWPFLRSRLGTIAFRKPKTRKAVTPQKDRRADLIQSGQVVWPLAVFNLLFLVQTWLDLTYLWAGVDLPSDFTYAEYAHRGTYPLVLSSLLAAAFILVVVRTNSAAERSPIVRMLVNTWMAQSVFLVFSSMRRLALYMDVYSLTYWRLFALVGMLLIAVGLISILARIWLHRSNGWLVTVNSAVAVLTFYIFSLVNIPGAVADYNVGHSHQLTGNGVRLDRTYLCSLGPEALPAIDKFEAGGESKKHFIPCRSRLVLRHKAQMSNWRGWSFYGWRLSKYLESKDRANLNGESKD